MTLSTRLRASVCVMAVSLFLTACGTDTQTTTTDTSGKPQVSMAQSAPTAENTYGEKRESLSRVESLYERNPKDGLIAARYAKALRESGDLKKAQTILTPVLKQKPVPTLAFTEMAAIDLETADFINAENFARRAIKVDNQNFRAWHVLGIALDAQTKHPEAQMAFEKALELWKGDKVPVMNNLALNLAAQGYTDKALNMLYEAQKEDSGRVEIERNIRIIRTLNEPAGQVWPKRADNDDVAPAAPKKTDEMKTDKPADKKSDKPVEKPKAETKKPKANPNAAANTAAQKVD
jgi:Flp pilus assembly protein TadD